METEPAEPTTGFRGTELGAFEPFLSADSPGSTAD